MAEVKDHDKIIGHLESEVGNLNSLVEKLFKKNDHLFGKMDSFMREVRPKPMSFNMVLGATVSILTVFALLFGSVIYIANSANAPMFAQLQVMNSSIQKISDVSTQHAAHIQLANQKMFGVMNKVARNEDKLRWLLFDENLPKQLTRTVGRVGTLEASLYELRGKGRLHQHPENKE